VVVVDVGSNVVECGEPILFNGLRATLLPARRKNLAAFQELFILARPLDEITVRETHNARDPDRIFFESTEIPRHCVLHGGEPPAWIETGTYRIHLRGHQT
jgi:hypothetical protein